MRLLATILVILAPLSAVAQERLAAYGAMIGPADRVNSSGVPLEGICNMVQQDRANVHRFGIRDRYDQLDTIFGSRDMRATIPSRCRVFDGAGLLRAALRRGGPFPVYVEIIGSAGRVTSVDIYYGAG